MERLSDETTGKAERLGEFAAELIGGQAEGGVGLIEGYAGLQAGSHEEKRRVVIGVGGGLEGGAKVDGRVGNDRGADDADDGVGVAAEVDGAADELRVGAEAPLPEGGR